MTAPATTLYAQLEDMLFGQDGALPITADLLVHVPEPREAVGEGHFFISPLDQIDFTKVVVQG